MFGNMQQLYSAQKLDYKFYQKYNGGIALTAVSTHAHGTRHRQTVKLIRPHTRLCEDSYPL